MNSYKYKIQTDPVETVENCIGYVYMHYAEGTDYPVYGLCDDNSSADAKHQPDLIMILKSEHLLY